MVNTQTPATVTSQTCWLSSSQQQMVFQRTTVGAVEERGTQGRSLVVLTPSLAQELIMNGHTVYFQAGFAKNAGFTDEQYTKVGAQLCKSVEEVYRNSSILLKVNPPQEQEYPYIQRQQVIFCFMNAPVTKEQQQQQQHFMQVLHGVQATLISYSALQNTTNTTTTSSAYTPFTPVHYAVSEIMGYLGVQQAMQMMIENNGVLFGGVTGTPGTNVLILGAGPCGVRAAQLAASQGAKVTVMDTNMEALKTVETTMMNYYGVYTLQYTRTNLEKILPNVNVVIGAVIPATNRAPVLINEQQMQLLQRGSIAIDLAACRGGNFATTNPTTIQSPMYTVNGITMYTPTDIIYLAPHAASNAISLSTLPFILQVANKGWRKAVMEFLGLQEGLFVAAGFFTNSYIASLNSCQYTPVEQVLESEIQQVATQQTNNIQQLKQQLNSFRMQQQTNTFTVQA